MYSVCIYTGNDINIVISLLLEGVNFHPFCERIEPMLIVLLLMPYCCQYSR